MRRLLFLLLTFLAGPAAAQRLAYSVTASWLFSKDSAAFDTSREPQAPHWEKVALPHTWNATDVLDDQPGYYRGVGWYKKTLALPPGWPHRALYLHVEGANQEAAVYVNGQLAGRHAGGYTAFNVPIGQLLARGGPAATTDVLVKVTNRYNPAIPPLSADFTFYGGLYRDVYLVAPGLVHFTLDNYASGGVFVATPQVSAQVASVEVRGTLTNASPTPRQLAVVTQLLDSAGRVVARQVSRLRVPAGGQGAFRQALPAVRRPHLWSPGRPYLYRAVSQVLDAGRPGVLDEVSNPVGLRWFRFDANQGFFLNGQPLKLIGTNRHQDYPGLGNALPDALAARDVQLLKEMGGNFLRVSHYPQDPAVLATCDRLGILASVEIPVVNAITDSPAFFENCRQMQTEMIRQNYNHPSVIIWAYMNEVLLRLPPGLKRDNEAGRAYLGRVKALARQLDSLSRREDPARATMLVCHGDFNLYQQAGLLAVPQVVGWNLYQGWYSGELQGFPDFLDRTHKALPTTPLLVTEYGADADERLHAFRPRRFDKTTEYANRYHEFYLRAILDRPFVAGSTVWNLAEFNSETRQEANPHVNTKSLLTGDRQPKDAYLLYQAHLLAAPFLKIGSRAWTLRAGRAAGPDSLVCRQPVDVYTNQASARLLLNGRDLGSQPAVFGIAHFRVPFGPGLNQLRALAPGQPLTDQVDIDFQLLPGSLADSRLPFTELNVSLGDERTFTDAKLHQVWVPEQPYAPGGWGYVGGHAYKLPGDRLPYGSDRNILGTDYDAVYETQRLGLEEFRADVPDGEYEITLHFAELEAAPAAEQLAYNLAGEKPTGSLAAKPGRAFGVAINGQPALLLGNAATELPPLQAVSCKVPASARGGQGLVVKLTAQVGEPILNGIQIKRLW